MSFKVGRQMSCILQVSRTHLGRLSGDQDKGKCQIGRYKTGDPSHQTSDSTDKTPIQICFKANIAMYSEKSEREREREILMKWLRFIQHNYYPTHAETFMEWRKVRVWDVPLSHCWFLVVHYWHYSLRMVEATSWWSFKILEKWIG